MPARQLGPQDSLRLGTFPSAGPRPGPLVDNVSSRWRTETLNRPSEGLQRDRGSVIGKIVAHGGLIGHDELLQRRSVCIELLHEHEQVHVVRRVELGSSPTSGRVFPQVRGALACSRPCRRAVGHSVAEQELAASARGLHPREFGLHHQVEPVTDQTGAHGGQHVNPVRLLAQRP